MKRGVLVPIFLWQCKGDGTMSQGDTAVFWAGQQEISLTSKLYSHIYTYMYVYILLLFSCFLFWSKFYTRRNCGLLFSKNSQTLSPLGAFRLEKEEERKKERTVTDPVFLYWIMSKPSKTSI
jgi:hypothetical protein